MYFLALPISARLTYLVFDGVVIVFPYYGMRAMLGLQVKMHGFSKFQRFACSAFFIFFASFAAFAVLLSIVARQPTLPSGMAFLMFASAARGALETYARGRQNERRPSLAT